MANDSRSADVIVVGAGHNGLTTAAYLAKAGLDVLVVEAYSTRLARRHLRHAAKPDVGRRGVL